MGKDTDYKWVGKRPVRPDGMDKVTGRAKFGADFEMPGQLVGKVLRSPHAHAIIKSIDTSAAKALPGVKAVMTAEDMPEQPDEQVSAGEMMVSLFYVTRNIMAREKALYDGHAVAAVAATSEDIAKQALDLIKVDYEVLPHVIDIQDALADDAPILHDAIRTTGIEGAGDKPSNLASRVEFGHGDLDAGFAAADVIVEREYNTKPVHQGYIEPHACVASYSADGQVQLWCSTQGQFNVRAFVSRLTGIETSQIRVTPSEIGGGFGGKTVVYLEPLSVILSKMSGKPVKMVMTRDEVFRGSGPTSGGYVKVKIGATNDGKITAAEGHFYLQAGSVPGSPCGPSAMCSFACYDLENVKAYGYDVVSNRPKVAAYRAPGSPISAFGVESAVDELALTLGIDPLEIRRINAAKEGTQSSYGPTFKAIGNEACLEAAVNSDHYKTPLGPNQGRGVASGFWFNIGGDSSAACHINEDGTATVISGNPDIGGSRAAMAQMAAETLGIDYHKVRPIVADTASIGFNFLTGGSRVTFATGMAVVQAAEDAVNQMKARAAKIWDIDIDAVVWENGEAKPAGSNAGDFDPLSLADLAAQAGKTGGPINGHASINAQGAGPGFGTHIVDVEVDPLTGKADIVRYTAIQDVGRAIHPSYVEGQLQGGVVQGVGWALNEEYIYNDKGQLENPGFLDYRIPVASDMPMIEAVIVEVPNDAHPYGVRGVGEVPICPPLAAVANAVSHAIDVRMADLPLSPPKVLKAIDDNKAPMAAE